MTARMARIPSPVEVPCLVTMQPHPIVVSGSR